jgi:hypothetical protein
MKSLEELVDRDYRQDLLCGDLAGYVVEGELHQYRGRVFRDLICLSEYKKARMALGNVSDESAENQYLRRSLPFVDMIADASGDLPMVS